MKPLQTYEDFLNESKNSLKIKLTGDSNVINHEKKIISKWDFDDIVSGVDGKVSELETDFIINFENGDYLRHFYKFNALSNKSLIEGKIGGKDYKENTTDYQDDYVPDNEGSYVKALVQYYLDKS